MPTKHTSKSISKPSSMANALPTRRERTPRNWPQLMSHLAYICAGLAVLLVFVQMNLYCLRYNRVYDSNVVTAVMMSNGQTYFGRLEKFGPRTLVLFDVYYLQVNETANDTAEETTTEGTTDSTDASADSNIKLVKLSDDFYQPNNYLVINRDQVLYWQHLSNDSSIIKAMSEYEEQGETE